VAVIVTNRGAFRLSQTAAGSLNLGAVAFVGVVPSDSVVRALNTVADLDAVSGISLGTERADIGTTTAAEDDVNNWVLLDNPDIVFASEAITANGHAIYHETAAADGSRDLIYVQTTGYPKSLSGGLTVATPSGIARLRPQTT
jgi:hypothetical protein